MAKLLRTQDLLRNGVDAKTIQRRVARGTLIKLRHAVYISAEDWHRTDDRGRHLLVARAHQLVNPTLVVCCLSASLAHHLPIPGNIPTEPALTAARGEAKLGATGRQGGAIGRRSWLDPMHIVELDGLIVTDLARTVIDCARHCSPYWTLAMADVAARNGMVVEVLRERTLALPKMTGRNAARWVAQHVDSRAESPLESLTRAVIIGAGLPTPTPQVWIATKRGRFRVDLLDKTNRVIIEADGRLKYENSALWEEKLREDALRDAGYEVVRFVMTDVAGKEKWLARYRAAIQRRARAA